MQSHFSFSHVLSINSIYNHPMSNEQAQYSVYLARLKQSGVNYRSHQCKIAPHMKMSIPTRTKQTRTYRIRKFIARKNVLLLLSISVHCSRNTAMRREFIFLRHRRTVLNSKPFMWPICALHHPFASSSQAAKSAAPNLTWRLWLAWKSIWHILERRDFIKMPILKS